MSVMPRSLDSASAARNAVARRDRLFFGGMAIAMLATVLVGFGPTYYFSTVSGTTFELTRPLHVHGAAFTSWMVLLVLQTSLVAAGRTDIHRKLGVFGAVLATLMMVLGAYVAVTRFRAGLFNPPPGIPAGVLLAIALATIVVFPTLFGSALLLRGRTDYHKRLVLIATAELVLAAVARWPGVAALGPPGFFTITDLFVVAIAIYDYSTRGRIHPATLWGGLFFIASQPLRLVIGFSPPWLAFCAWLAS
jgi:energy-converting hydrogenase Eha subunit A